MKFQLSVIFYYNLLCSKKKRSTRKALVTELKRNDNMASVATQLSKLTDNLNRAGIITGNVGGLTDICGSLGTLE